VEKARKKKILLGAISSVFILSLLLMLGAVYLRNTQSVEEILQSSTYKEMFGISNMEQGQNPVAYGILENMTFDIVEISDMNNNSAIATINVTMPDMVRIYLEIADSVEALGDISENVLWDMAMLNIQNYFITVRREMEVIQNGERWRILNRSEIDDIILEQQNELVIELIKRTEFEPININNR